MTLLSILTLGFLLGMRHATDSDHVVAITTIITQQRNVFSAALTGMFWGIATPSRYSLWVVQSSSSG